MKHKLCLLLTAVLFISMLSGCSVLFSDTYHSETDFQGNQPINLVSDYQTVQNYAELRRLVFGLMNRHEETLFLRFAGYTGNVVSDIASVCNAVKTESAYGAYCVDYISYDLTQIVSYYEAVISISYTYSLEELQAMQTINHMDSFEDLIADALQDESENIVARVNNGLSDHAAVLELLQQTIRNHPLSISYLPKFSVKIYSGNSSQKIYDVTIQYDETVQNDSRLTEMKTQLERAEQEIRKGDAALMLGDAAIYLSNTCEFSDVGDTTAYDALVAGKANSEGIASAFKALCDRLDVECLVVSGQIDRQKHCWNIVRLENAYYHVDVSVLETKNPEKVPFLSDAQQQVRYWWDPASYPECNGEIRSETVNFLN